MFKQKASDNFHIFFNFFTYTFWLETALEY